jgi:hypothetical protein
MNRPALIEKRAVLHVHTKASDGTGSMEQIIGEAMDAGADILGINDHRTLWARDMGYGGWHSSLFVLAGTELEDANENSHILAYGIDRLPPTSVTSEQIENINSQGGIALAAHPTEAPGRLPRTRSYSWKAGTEGLAGVEVWNYMSLWKKGISIFNARSKYRHPDRNVEHPDAPAVEFWRDTGGCAVAGPDAHALRFGTGRAAIVVFPYSMLFRRFTTHILLEEELPRDAKKSEGLLLDSLRRGSCFCSNAQLGDARGFRASVSEGTLALVMPGAGEVEVRGTVGTVWKGSLEEGEHMINLGPGERISVEVSRKGGTWIFCGIP